MDAFFQDKKRRTALEGIGLLGENSMGIRASALEVRNQAAGKVKNIEKKKGINATMEKPVRRRGRGKSPSKRGGG